MNTQKERIRRLYQRYAKNKGYLPYTDEYLDELADYIIESYKNDEKKIHAWLLCGGNNKIWSRL